MKLIIYISACVMLISCNTRTSATAPALLNKELHQIYRFDQRYRQLLSNLSPVAKGTIVLWKKQNNLDSLNLIRVIKILDSMGFPHKPMFDDSAAMATFMVIQHATLQQQEKYLPLFEKAAEKKELKPSAVALMIDRIKVDKGEKQIYGTQAIPVKDPKTGYLTDKYALAPIDDEENVNIRRSKVGLSTIEQGAKELGVEYIPTKKSGN